jgi:hypothetical protein
LGYSSGEYESKQIFYLINPRFMNPPDFEALRILFNNAPLDEFAGLTPNEMEALLYDPLGERSPIALRPDLSAQTLDSIPYFRLTEEMLRMVQREGTIKLTPLGALPKKFLHELYDQQILLERALEEGITKLTREVDSVVLTSLHLTTRLTGALKKANNKLTLTKKGVKLLVPDQRQTLFRLTLETFTLKFNWAYNDRYTEHPVAQQGWAYTVYLLLKFGEHTHQGTFYADQYIRAFPEFLGCFGATAFRDPLASFKSCYTVRTFDRFLEWFGLVSLEGSKRWSTEAALVKTNKVFLSTFSMA